MLIMTFETATCILLYGDNIIPMHRPIRYNNTQGELCKTLERPIILA